MSILYGSFSNGSDANAGNNFPNRFQTITSGATSARTAPGDTIRWMQSPDPLRVQTSGATDVSATFTDKSQTITLDNAATLNIFLDGAWTASPNVTCSTVTTRKEGSNAARIAPASAFTTGLAAYYATGTIDCSGYTKVTFWINGSNTISANVWQLCLCSDAAGATPVNSFTINQSFGNGFQCFTFDNGSALDSSIQSVALYALSDPGTTSVDIDNVLAANRLTLTSLVGKSSANYSFEWYPIQSINGTTVLTDYHKGNNNGATRGYSGTTETVAIYSREPVRVTATQTIQESGSAGSYIAYSGGWNESDMTSQDGLTFIDISGGGITIFTCAQNYIAIDRFVFVRSGSSGFNITSTCRGLRVTNSASIANSLAVNFATTNLHPYFDNVYCIANNAGVSLGAINSRLNNLYCYGNGSSGISTPSGTINNGLVVGGTMRNNTGPGISVSYGLEVHNVTSQDNTTYGFVNAAGLLKLINCTTSGNTSGSVQGQSGGTTLIDNLTPSEGTVLNFSDATSLNRAQFSRYGGDPLDQRIYVNSSSTPIAKTQTSVRHTAADVAWQYDPTTEFDSTFPFIHQLGYVSQDGSGAITPSIWVRRTNANGVIKLVVRGGQLDGVSTDQIATISAAVDTWEEIALNFTPTEAGVFRVELWIYGTGTLYADDFDPN